MKDKCLGTKCTSQQEPATKHDDALHGFYSDALKRERELHTRLTSACVEIENLKKQLRDAKIDRHYWWQSSLDLMCKIDELENEVPEAES